MATNKSIAPSRAGIEEIQTARSYNSRIAALMLEVERLNVVIRINDRKDSMASAAGIADVYRLTGLNLAMIEMGVKPGDVL